MKQLIYCVTLLLVSTNLIAQISGTVTGSGPNGTTPVPNVTVHWKGTDVSTTTDENGKYTIEKPDNATILMVHSIGYEVQEQSVISRKGTMNFTLAASGEQLDDVLVTGRRDATSIDLDAPALTMNIDQKELRKAACCNLSESFETNATVDVSFADGVTGTRQIEMLGLTGKYVLIQRENIPFARGLNTTTGMTFIPGPFVESIQVSKGLSSVTNGYESISGQINVELHNPIHEKAFMINGYVNQGARTETNIYAAHPLNRNLETALLAHVSTIPFAQDKNGDGFADIPTGTQINLHNRWKYLLNENWGGQFGVSAINDQRSSGQVEGVFDDESVAEPWIFTEDNNRFEFFGKTGYLNLSAPYRSLGLIYGANYHDREAILGGRRLRSNQSSAYLNAIYQDILVTTDHQYRTGLSFQYDHIEEHLHDTLSLGADPMNLGRREAVPGAFFEYTYTKDLQWTVVAGARVDYNSLFGWIFTPRLHIRYMPSETTTLRLGGGRGQRTANPLNENISGLASGRVLRLDAQQPMNTEIAWNSGASITQAFNLGNRRGSMTTDAYYTWFDQKLITDFDRVQHELWVYYAQGSSSLSTMAQIDLEVITNMDIRLAYKYLRSLDAFTSGMDLAYAIPEHRAFANLSYDFGHGWRSDVTYNWFGSRRMPSTDGFPVELQGETYSPDYSQVNLQVNKSWKSGWEIYAGVENLFDYRQKDPITDAPNPYSRYFDTNRVYGPIFGRMIYLGFYYKM